MFDDVLKCTPYSLPQYSYKAEECLCIQVYSKSLHFWWLSSRGRFVLLILKSAANDLFFNVNITGLISIWFFRAHRHAWVEGKFKRLLWHQYLHAPYMHLHKACDIVSSLLSCSYYNSHFQSSPVSSTSDQSNFTQQTVSITLSYKK